MLPASGGAYSYRQLEQLWTSAGGSSKLAPIMAAIAMAESGGNPNATNPTDNGGRQTSWGLWQISNGTHSQPAPNILDPTVNARQAVAKYKAQGLKAWGTYTSGLYKNFLQGNTKAAGVSGGAGFVDEAKKFLGTPYVWGGDKPGGFDCSGLVQYALEQIGLKNVPRTSEEQWAWVQKIKRSQLEPGDLVFYAGSDGTAASPGHVAIYAGNGQIIQAPHTGADVDEISLASSGTPVGYGRVPGISKGDFLGAAGAAAGAGAASGTQSAELTSISVPSWAAGIPILGPIFSVFGDVADMTGIPQVIAQIANGLSTVEQGIAWFFVPSHWVRIFAGVFGTGFVIGGVVTMTRTGKGNSIQMPVQYQGSSAAIPYPGGQLAPAVGIAQVTIGAVLLFIAFHNLPVTVDSFGGMVSYLQAEVQNQGKQAA